MLYSALIAALRAQNGDATKPQHVDFTADGSSNVFVLPTDTFPVYDDATTYTVKVGGVAKTETTDYTLDKTTGVIQLVATPASETAVTIDHKSVHLQDSNYIQIINDTIKSMGDDFWKEFVDEANYTTTANMLSISLVALQPQCIAVYDFQYRNSTTDNWATVSDLANWRYDRDNNVIYIGDREAFSEAGKALRIRGLKTYVLGTVVTATVDVQDKFMTIVEAGTLARYWRWRYKDVIELVSKMTTEATRTPLQELIMLVDRFERMYETEKARLKPQKPVKIVPRFLNGGGRP